MTFILCVARLPLSAWYRKSSKANTDERCASFSPVSGDGYMQILRQYGDDSSGCGKLDLRISLGHRSSGHTRFTCVMKHPDCLPAFLSLSMDPRACAHISMFFVRCYLSKDSSAGADFPNHDQLSQDSGGELASHGGGFPVPPACSPPCPGFPPPREETRGSLQNARERP